MPTSKKLIELRIPKAKSILVQALQTYYTWVTWTGRQFYYPIPNLRFKKRRKYQKNAIGIKENKTGPSSSTSESWIPDVNELDTSVKIHYTTLYQSQTPSKPLTKLKEQQTIQSNNEIPLENQSEKWEFPKNRCCRNQKLIEENNLQERPKTFKERYN